MKKATRKLTKDVAQQVQDHASNLQKGKLKAVVLDPIREVRCLPIGTFRRKGKKADIICGDPPWRNESNHFSGSA